LPSEPKPLASTRRIPAQALRIELLAKQTGLANAHRWFVRERAWINERQLQLCRIGAPTFLEQRRAEWLREQLTALGWDAALDRAGNVTARFGAGRGDPAFVVSAHLDTVLAPHRGERGGLHGNPPSGAAGWSRSRSTRSLHARISLGADGDPEVSYSPVTITHWQPQERTY